MIEYEYSFKVKDYKKFIKYCEDNSYNLLDYNFEIRTLYKNNSNIMARITTLKSKNNLQKHLDFKEDNPDKLLKNAKETLKLEINKNNEDAIHSIIDILNYKLVKTLKRNRYVYKKDNVIFEIDRYVYPEKCFVVAIEGIKEEVDNVYNEVKNVLNSFIL